MSPGPDAAATNSLVLGPALRHVATTTATVWAETRAAGVMVVRCGGHEARAETFTVLGHHYALAVLQDLDPGTETEYEVLMDGVVLWPTAQDHRPPPTIRTLPEPGAASSGEAVLDIVFGSCRTDRPQEPPYTLAPEEHRDGVGHDALVAMARDCQRGERRIPDLLMMLGDQVYADEGLSPVVRRRQIERRGAESEPTTEIFDFEEYTWLYRDAWSDPDVRWLLTTVPSAMIFDDHDVRDDWNTSEAWRTEIRTRPWWEARITGAYMSYWIYQHLGNLSPEVLAQDELLSQVRAAGRDGGDAGPVLAAFAAKADDEVDGHKDSFWSYSRDLGRSRLVVIDTRSGRVLGGTRRDMVSDDEWDQVAQWLRGDVDHLIVASSLPVALERSLHDLEAWNEAVCGGAWGPLMARAGEWVRQGADLEHWAAFQHSFRRLVDHLGEVAAGHHGRPPSTVLILSGDVHHSYVAPLRYPPARGVRSPVVQVVSSPLRNGFPAVMRRAFRFADSPVARAIGRGLRRSVRMPPAEVTWKLTNGPRFGNGLGSVHLAGRTAVARLERAVAGERGPTLQVRASQPFRGAEDPAPAPVGSAA